MDGGGGVLLVVEADVVYGILVFHAIIQKHQLQICIVKIKLTIKTNILLTCTQYPRIKCRACIKDINLDIHV